MALGPALAAWAAYLVCNRVTRTFWPSLVQLPAVGDSLQLVQAPVLELDPRSRHQILHCLRNEGLACPGHRRDPRADMDGDAPELVSHDVTLARVETDAEIHSDLVHGPEHRLGALDGRGRGVEGCEKAVAGGVDLAAAEPA